MKKSIKILVALMLIVLFCIPAFASDNHDIEDLSNIEVIPPDDSVFTDVQKQNIVNHLLEIEATMSTYSILCTLFGHNYTVEAWTIIQHKYYDSSPRCVVSHYDVSICSRCDHVTSTLLSSSRIPCC